MTHAPEAQERLDNLVRRIEVLAAQSECDLGLIDIPWGSKYELFRNGKWMNATDALYEQVSPTDIADDIGIEKFIEILERWLEDEP